MIAVNVVVAKCEAKELKAFKDAAKIVLNLSDEKLTTAIKEGAFIEVPKPGPGEKK